MNDVFLWIVLGVPFAFLLLYLKLLIIRAVFFPKKNDR